MKILNKFLANKNRMKLAWYAMIVLALVYTLISYFLGQVHATPSPDPYLRIPNESYYYWATIWYGAAMIAGWILATACMQLMARAFHGRGTFEDTLAVSGLATAIASIPTAIPDLVTTYLQWIGVLDAKSWQYAIQHPGFWNSVTWGYIVVYLIFFFILYPIAVKTVHSLKTWQSIVIGIIGFIIYQGFIFIFIR